MRFWLTLVLALPAAAAPSPLAARGYAVLPVPQRVTLGSADFRFGNGWSVERENVAPDDVAVASLREGLGERFHVHLSSAPQRGSIRLVLSPGSVANGEQAYRLELRPRSIAITANAPAGLFYGVQTLLQLIRPRGDALWVPEGEIVDWPDLHLRQIYWDDAHHLDRPDVLRAAIRQAAFFKINGFVLKLEGHFQYRSAPAIVEPYALSPAELQSLTDYALRYNVQLIPYLDAPAHIAFILKHPEYAALRAFPESNYEGCVVDPDVYRLYTGLFRDLLDANRGGRYFYLSTDEPYYVGLSRRPGCDEAERAAELGSVGRLLGEFVTRTAGWLHDRGREVIFWGEYPMKPADLDSVPPYLINGETNAPDFDAAAHRRGIRQMIYVSTQGEERLFPRYSRIDEIVRKISTDPARQNDGVIGVVNAAWADAGLHPETFWLGYAAGTASAWHSAPPGAAELTASFYPLFYGWKVEDMDRVYRLMSAQAQFWSDSWETGPSHSRKPIWGNSNSIFNPPRPAHDQFLPLPPARDNSRRLELAKEFLKQNDELRGLLTRNLQLADFNRYNLEVFRSIADICRHNLTLLTSLDRLDLNVADSLREDRDAVLRGVTRVWYKSWYPRVAQANGRRFLHEFDDVKDHPADRTVDLTYLLQRESLLDDWIEQLRSARSPHPLRPPHSYPR